MELMIVSKHDEIIKYLYEQKEGTKISVRQISRILGVSEGTSYRAIKEAEKDGIIKTIPRVGSIRVLKEEIQDVSNLSYQQVLSIIEGKILAGHHYMEQVIDRIIIGAMELDALTTYLEPGALLIVGNREDAQKEALETQSGILITGGFTTSNEILQLAEDKKLPVISTTFDTFTVAATIQREIYSVTMAKEMVMAQDFVVNQVEYTYDFDKQYSSQYVSNDKITILLKSGKYLGTVWSKELHLVTLTNYNSFLISGIELERTSTLQRMRQLMSWEQLNILPVIDGDKFIGIVHRRDVFKEMIPNKMYEDMTLDNVIEREVVISDQELSIKIAPVMTDEFGTLTQSQMMALVEKLLRSVLQSRNISSYHIDSYQVTQIKLIQLSQEITMTAEILDIGHQYVRVEVTITSQKVKHSTVMLLIQHYQTNS